MNVVPESSNGRDILGYGAYLPQHRLERAAITQLLGAGAGRGTRAVAGFDEDSTSMAVEAARTLLEAPNGGPSPDLLVLATTSPAYADKTNATAVHAALDLDVAVGAYDTAGAVRSGAGALRAALRSSETTLLVSSDVRGGRPGSADEATSGDGAVALLIGQGPNVIAELLASSSQSIEALERWRAPGERSSRLWEDRFGEAVYVPVADAVIADVLKQAGTTIDEVDHVLVTGTHARAVARVRKGIGAAATTGAHLDGSVGNTGVAALPLAVADCLDQAVPGALVLAIGLADGADAFLFRVTPAIEGRRPPISVAELAGRGVALPYATYLTWRGELDREGPRRPDPESPAGPPSARTGGWKFGFHGSRCVVCATRHLPPQRVCMECGSVDQMTTERLTGARGTVVTFTVDRLAFSLHPPVVAAVVDLDGGGRFQCELTDLDPATVAVGDRVELTFRRLFTVASTGVHNYFWKARPARSAPEGED